MEPNSHTSQPQPISSPPPAPMTPVITSPKPKKNVFMLIIEGVIILGIIIAVGIGLVLWKFPPKQISSYEECVKAKGIAIQPMYPGICIANGKQFIDITKELTEEENKRINPPDPTANWSTYADINGKFTFKFPEKLTPKDQNSEPDANEYTQLFRVFTTFMGDSTPEFVVRVRNGFNAQQMEKEDFDDIEGHVDYKIIKREEINLSGKNAVKISVFVGPPEDFRETSGVIYIYSDIDLQESLLIRQLGMDTDQFNQILSTFKFIN